MPTNYLARNLNGVLLDFETILAIRPKNYLKMDYVHVKIPCFVYNIICLSNSQQSILLLKELKISFRYYSSNKMHEGKQKEIIFPLKPP